MTIEKFTVKQYIDPVAGSARIYLKKEHVELIGFPEKKELLAEFDTETNKLCITML